MRRSRGHTISSEQLVEGLNQHERLVRVEAHLQRVDSLLRHVEDLIDSLEHRIEDLESAVRRLHMPWYVRWVAGLRRVEKS